MIFFFWLYSSLILVASWIIYIECNKQREEVKTMPYSAEDFENDVRRACEEIENKKQEPKMTKKLIFEILKSKNNQFFWRIKSMNGKILCVSETYKTKQACLKTMDNLYERVDNSKLKDLS